MGMGIGFRCWDCGYKFAACLGVGFAFPRIYQETVSSIRAGKYGREWKELFESTPGAAVNADQELYVCSGCGRFRKELNLTLYEPKDPGLSKVHNTSFSVANPADGAEYVVPWELADKYRMVKVYRHMCDCGKRMHLVRVDDRLKCPECEDGWMARDPYGDLNWD